MSFQKSRRYFFYGAAAAAVTRPATYGYVANDQIRVGCIGTGGRAQVLMRNFEVVKGLTISAVCDIWTENLAKAKQLAGPSAFATSDYRAVLDRKDLDAVLIGAPDHWHAPLTIAACQAGKDVYVEKPLTHDVSEGAAVIEAQNKYRRIVQTGTQQRSMPHIQKAAEIVRSGKIGNVHKVHMTWNRNQHRWTRTAFPVDAAQVDWKAFLGSAKAQPFDAYKFRQWRWFWDFGGGIFTDLMVHQIDTVHWILGLDHPTEAVSIGDHFAAKGVWETPDTAQTLMKYPGQELQAYFEGTFINARNAAMIELMGTDGTMYLDRGRYELYPDPKKQFGQPPEPAKFAYSEMVIGEGPRGADFYKEPNGEALHLANWAESMRSRKTPIAPAEAGVGSASAAHLANRALRSGQVAHWGR